ncbi:MAG: hypothetical protein ABFS02_12040 [Pseudomonadota bacterium]
MKQNNVTKGLVAALLLASPLAGAEEQYPAADFEPVIVYQDADYIGKQSQPAAQDVDYSETPAANFEPVVVYQDKDYIEKHEQAATTPAPTKQAAATTGSASAQRQAATPAPAMTEQAAPAPVATEAKSDEPAGESGGLFSGNLPIVVIALAVVGVVVWNSKRGASKVEEVEPEPAPYIGGTEGETGVAKYLRNLGLSAGGAGGKTGVAKYLENLETSATETGALTGVAKYMQKQDMSAT